MSVHNVDDVDVENFTAAGCCLYARIQITNYDNVTGTLIYTFVRYLASKSDVTLKQG